MDNDKPLEFKFIPGLFTPKIKAAMSDICGVYVISRHAWMVMDFVEDKARKILEDSENDPPMIEMEIPLRGPAFKDERKKLCIFGAAWDHERRIWLIPPELLDLAESIKADCEATLQKIAEDKAAKRRSYAAFKAAERLATPEGKAKAAAAQAKYRTSSPAYVARKERAAAHARAMRAAKSLAEAPQREARKAAIEERKASRELAKQERKAGRQARKAAREAARKLAKQERNTSRDAARELAKQERSERSQVITTIRKQINFLKAEQRLFELRRATFAVRLKTVAMSQNVMFELIQEQSVEDQAAQARDLKIAELQSELLKSKLTLAPPQTQEDKG